MRLHLYALSMIFLLAPVPAAGVTPRLVKDINPFPVPESSAPERYVPVGGLVYFSASDSDTGRELWRSDGTVAGTFQVADSCPGECSGNPGFMFRTDKSYFFRVPAAQTFAPFYTFSELWVTGGLPSDTFRLTGVLGLPSELSRRLWMASKGLFYFAADDGVHGMELWRSDGTPTGTFLVSDLRPGPAGSEPEELTELNGRLFFRADDGVQGSALWTSDGTPQGTRMVVDPNPHSASLDGPFFLRAAGRFLFFLALAPKGGEQLWKSDGTSRGSAPLINIRLSPSSPLSGLVDAVVLGKRLLFVIVDPAQGQELWASDGTARGTQPLTQFAGPEAFIGLDGFKDLPLPQLALGKLLVFPVDDGVHGIELWVTDGTRKGTRLLADACPGVCSSLAVQGNFLPISGNLIYYAASDGVHGTELWATDGTTAGTRMIQDLCPGSCSSSPAPFSAGAGKVFAQALDAGRVQQLWSSDGSAQGTVRLTDFTRAGSLRSGGAAVGGAFLFTADDGQHGRELWRSGGRPESTGLLADLNASDLGGSNPTALRAAGGKLFFFADDGLHGRELWTSDGTEAGTALAYEFVPGPGSAVRPFLGTTTEAGGALFFSLDSTFSSSLWRTDGTQAGTLRLTPEEVNVNDFFGFRSFGGIAAVGNQVFFAAADEDHGEELWVSDGTAAGTRLAMDLEPGEDSSFPGNQTAFQGRLLFTVGTPTTGFELWRTDGTPGGTLLLKSFGPPLDIELQPRLMTEHAGRLYFFAWDEEHGFELWSSDGTAAGTTLAADLAPGPESFRPVHLIPAGSRLFLSGARVNQFNGLYVSDGTAAGTRRISDAPVGSELPVVFNGDLYFSVVETGILWKSDGTPVGTVPLPDRNGQPISEPESFQVFGGRLFFTTSQGELFQSDGTPAGTFRLLDLSGPFNSSSVLVPAGPHLFFPKWDRATGWELWALEP